MKTNNALLKTAFAVLLFALVFAGGCKNFMSNADDFKKNIATEVAVANADQVTVNVAPANTSMGSTTPYPTTTAKVGVAFSVAATANSSYGFIRWAAFIGSTSTDETSGLVTFADPSSSITTAVIIVARSDIYIRPVFERRPYITSFLPQTGLTGAVVNAPICIYFSKPIAPTSFTFDSGSTKDSSGEFKNITVTTTTAGTETSLASLYNASVLSADQKKLTIKNKTALTSGKTIKITVSDTIVDTSGLAMGETNTFDFIVGTNSDNLPPVIGTITGGRTINSSNAITNAFGSDKYTRRVGTISSSAPLYLVVAGEDNPSSGSIDSVSIHDYYVTDANGVSKSEKLGSNTTTASWSSNSGTLVTIKDLSPTTLDGEVMLRVDLEDVNGNSTDTLSGSDYNYSFVLDTTPPPVDNEQINRITISAAGSGTAGYYNASATIPFVPSVSSPLLDYGLSSYRSSIVYYRFGFTAADFTDSLPWSIATTTANLLVSGYTGSDSLSVPIYFQLKDDLGNASEVTKLGTVAIDKTKPAGTIAATSVTTVNSKQMIGAYNSIPVSVSGTDATSGIKSFYAVGGDGETQPTAPTLASTWTDYSTTQTATVSMPTDTSGSKHVWVWFRDKADNISEAIKDTQTLVLDNVDPVVTKFYLNKTTAFSTTAAPSAQAKQYTNTLSLYFAFTATESTGIGSFSYSADGGTTWSKYFSVATTAAQTDADQAGYGVSLCNSKEISTGNWLVTGVLTVPAVDGDKPMQIKVRDVVRTTSAVSAYTTIANITGVMYDATDPVLTGTSLTAASSYTGSYAYVGGDDVTLAYTASDAGSGINTRAISGDLLTAVTTTNLGSTVEEQVAEGLSTVTKSEALTLTSADGLKSVTVKVYDWAGNSVFKTFLLYLDTTPPTFTTILNQTSSSSTTYTNATTGGVTLYGPAQASKSWPSFYTYMTTHVDAGSGIPTGLTQQMRLYRVTSAQIAAAVAAGKLAATASGYSGTVVGGDLLSGYTALDDATTLTTTTDPVLVSYNFGKTITLPVDATLGRPLSGYYVAGFKALDNLGNISSEQKTGYFYDQTPPVISKVEVYDGTTLLSPYNNGTYNIIKAPASNHATVRLYVTDCPSGDPNGSGISTLAPHIYYRTNGANNEANPAGGYQDTAQSIAESADGYVTVNFGSVAYWDLSAYQYLILHATVSDASGNANATKYDYPLAMDNANPTYTAVSWPTSYSGAVSGVSYVNTNTITFTPGDPVTFYMASGVSAWALTSSASAPADASTEWQTYASGTVDASSKLSSLIGSSSSPVYLYLKDKVGNVNSYSLGTMRLDTTKPVITGNPVVATDSGFTNSAFTTDYTNWFTNKTSVYIHTKANDRVTDPDGSGIKKIVTTCSADSYNPRTVTIASPAQTETADTWYQMANSATTGGYWDGYTGMTTAWSFSANVYDAVENYMPTSTCYLYYDNKAPAVSVFTVNGTTTVNSVQWSGPGTTIDFTANDVSGNAGASGIASWGLSTSAIAPLATATGSAAGWTGWKTVSSPVTGSGSRSLTTAAGDISGLISGSNHIYIYLMDNVGNISTGTDVGTFSVDGTAPASADTSCPVLTGSTGASSTVKFVKSANASLTFSSTDNTDGSGIALYYISKSSSETDTVLSDVFQGTTPANSIRGAFDGSSTTVSVASLLSTTAGTDLYLYIFDAVGNVLKYGKVTGSLPVQLDDTAPEFTTPDSNNDVVINPLFAKSKTGSDGSPSISTLTSNTVKFFITNTETGGSGIKTITLSGNVDATQPAWTIKKAPGIAGSWGSALAGSNTNLVYTFTDQYTDSDPLVITGVTLTDASPNAVTVTLTDAAGNSASGISQTVTMDSKSPGLLTSVLSDSSGSSSYCNEVSPVLTLTCFDTDDGNWNGATTKASGISKFVFSGTGLASLSGVSVSINGTAISGLSLGTEDDSAATVITLPSSSYVKAASTSSGNIIVINGLQLTSGDGTKTVSVTAYDAAGNASSVSSPTIMLDTVNSTAPTLALGSSNGSNIYPTSFAATEYFKSGTSFYLYASGGETASLTASGAISYLYNTANDSATASALASSAAGVAFAPSSSTLYYVWAVDKAGNISTASSTVTLVPDASVLSVTLANATAKTLNIISSGSTYYSKAAQVTFSALDTGGSGIKEYALSTADGTTTPVSASNSITDVSGDGWATWTGTELANQEFTSLFNSTPSKVYLHVKDNVGNVSTSQVVYDASNYSWTYDGTGPAISAALAFVQKSASFTTTGSGSLVSPYFVSPGTVTFMVTDSGPDNLTYSVTNGSGTVYQASAAISKGVEKSFDFPATASASPLMVTLTDAVGNTSTGYLGTSTTYWTADSTGPTPSVTVTPLTDKAIVKGSGTYYTNGAQAAFTMADVGGSGSAKYIISTLSDLDGSSPSAPTASDSVTISWQTLVATGTLPTASSGEIPFSGIISAGAPVYLYTKDAVGNIVKTPLVQASGDGITNWTADTTGPSITVTPPSYYGSSNPLYVKASASFKVTIGDDSAGISSWTVDSSTTPVSPWTYNRTSSTTGVTDSTVTFPATLTSPSAMYAVVKDDLGNTTSLPVVTGATWLVDPAAPPATGMIAHSTGYYLSAPSANAATVFCTSYGTANLSVSTAPVDPVITTGVSGSGVQGYASISSGTIQSSVPVTTAATGTTFYIRDNVDNEQVVSVTSTLDNAYPTFVSPATWKQSTAISVSLATDGSGSGLKSVASSSASAFSDLSVGEATLTAIDNVDNTSAIKVYIPSTDVVLPLYVTLPALWSSSGGTISGIVSKCATWTLDGPSGFTQLTGTGAVTGFSGLTIDGSYTLTLTDSVSLAVTFTVTSGKAASIRVTGNPVIDGRISGTLISSTLKKNAISTKINSRTHSLTGLVSWSSPEMKADSLSLVSTATVMGNEGTGQSVTDKSDSLSVVSLHSLQLARARAKLVQSTDLTQNGNSINSRPEKQNNIKQDDGSTDDGVCYNQKQGLMVYKSMEPLATKYMEMHGVNLATSVTVTQTPENHTMPVGQGLSRIDAQAPFCLPRRGKVIEMDS